MRILAFLIATSAWGQITSIPGLVNPSGGAIGGASAVATGQVLYGTGAGVAGSKNTFVFDPAVDRLNFGSAVRANGQVLNMYELGNIRYGIGVATSALRFYNPGSGNQTVFGTVSTADGSTFTEQMRLVGGTGNLLLNTTTDDGTNRLQVAGSIRAHDLNILDPTATLGATLVNVGWNGTDTSATTTQLVVRAGTVQGSTNLQTWQNAAGGTLANVDSGGNIFGNQVLNVADTARITGTGLGLASNRLFGFSSTTSSGGAADASLSRAGINVIQVGDGGANSNGRVWATAFRAVGVTVAELPPAAGNAGMRATVTNANATTIGTTVAGGGSNTVLVWSNGTNWRIYAN
jgi:hypothetical protein